MGGVVLGLLGRHALPIGLAAALAMAVFASWEFRTQRDAARSNAAMATQAAEANAAALAQAMAQHAQHIAALTGEAERARSQAVRLGAHLEALRRDPSHAASAAPVLRDAVERLRAHRTAADPSAAAAPP